jgi:hypothetical protein
MVDGEEVKDFNNVPLSIYYEDLISKDHRLYWRWLAITCKVPYSN